MLVPTDQDAHPAALLDAFWLDTAHFLAVRERGRGETGMRSPTHGSVVVQHAMTALAAACVLAALAVTHPPADVSGPARVAEQAAAEGW
ncbi:hypothetical protein ACIGFK_04150 [Streptomyces sp. NPDC085524]|uniref:hypothetical protein n=1 Tax=Streptomyces sp. NPDC085524 TaxID=3365728 RepID=UPI0037D625E1